MLPQSIFRTCARAASGMQALLVRPRLDLLLRPALRVLEGRDAGEHEARPQDGLRLQPLVQEGHGEDDDDDDVQLADDLHRRGPQLLDGHHAEDVEGDGAYAGGEYHGQDLRRPGRRHRGGQALGAERVDDRHEGARRGLQCPGMHRLHRHLLLVGLRRTLGHVGARREQPVLQHGLDGPGEDSGQREDDAHPSEAQVGVPADLAGGDDDGARARDADADPGQLRHDVPARAREDRGGHRAQRRDDGVEARAHVDQRLVVEDDGQREANGDRGDEDEVPPERALRRRQALPQVSLHGPVRGADEPCGAEVQGRQPGGKPVVEGPGGELLHGKLGRDQRGDEAACHEPCPEWVGTEPKEN
mmetsp:Transcript_28607/g.80841  ORF Transcript_28607/g.80841 Transcript_28607/m.80841 type:complete len:359 (+) Transcript_28607:95-1171(+)